jgi:RNA polymerase sigma-70 factor (ECF subfamily)
MSAGASGNDFESGLKPLWMRAQAGDEVAYRAALTLIASRLRGYFARRLQSMPDEVEDLVQETLIALHLQRGTCDPALPASAWVYAIARHKLVDLWRRRGHVESQLRSLDTFDDSEMPAAPEELPARRDLLALLEGLPAAQRRAIALTKLEGLSVAEASLRCGISVSALKVRVHRGLKRLTLLARGGS